MYEQFLAPQNLVAVVGVSSDPKKYGSRVYRTLKDYGVKVVAVNPKYTELYGDKIFPDLASLPQKPDVVNIIVPPAVTEEIVKQAKGLGITKVWMQPGAESAAAIKFSRENGIECVSSACIIIDGLHKSFLY